MATATVTISRPSSTDSKPIVSLNATHDGTFRAHPFQQHNNTLQHPNTTGPGQPGQAQTPFVDNAAQNTASPDRVAIPTLSQQRPLPTQQATITPSAPMGPVSRTVQIPPRPKPGRKPLPHEDAQDRRRVQNRVAQRNFRDKRAMKVSELTADNDRIRRESSDKDAQHAIDLHDQKERFMKEIAQLKMENETLRNQLDDTSRQLHSVKVTKSFADAGFPNAGLQSVGSGTSLPSINTDWRGPATSYNASKTAITPPEEELETDMSHIWARSAPRPATNNHSNNHNMPDNSNQWLDSGMDVDREDDGCGFCTDESNCSCAQAKKAETVLAPGGCDACIRDPERAAACKALAAQTHLSQRPQTSASMAGMTQRNDSMAAPPGSGTMSCSKFVDSLGQSRYPSIHELFGNTLHSYPAKTPGSGYDVNEQEAAQVLQSMSGSRRNTMAGAPGQMLDRV